MFLVNKQNYLIGQSPDKIAIQYHYFHELQPMQNQQGNDQEDILTLKQKIFNFMLNSNRSQYNQPSTKASFRNSFHNSFGVIKQENQWKPKIPCKRIYEDPKFLLSLERRKFRVINGLRQSDFQINSTNRNQFKSARKKVRKQVPSHRSKIVSQPQKFTQNYTHASLNLSLNENHRVSRTPYLNFNLHHLIKQRKQALTQQYDHQNNYPRKKGSNIPYYTSVLSQKLEKNLKNAQPQENNVQKVGYRHQIKTSKTIQGRRSKYNRSMGQKRYQQQIKQ